MSRRLKFPLVIQRGSVEVRVFKNAPSTGHTSYTINYYLDGKRQRKTYSNFKEAKTEAEFIANKLAQGELSVVTQRDADRSAYVRAVELLRPTGIGIETAAMQFSEAIKKLKGISLSEVCDYYLKQHPTSLQSKPVADVVEELLVHKASKGRSAKYLKQLRCDLERFAAAFKCSMSTITTSDIERYLAGLKVAPRTVNNHRGGIGTLFSFAVARKYVPKDHPGVKGVDVMSVVPKEVEVFTVEEMTALLTHGRPEIIPYLVIRAFAGIRDEEMTRLDWKHVKINDCYIEVPHRAAKLKIRRMAPILPNLKEWLLPHYQTVGPIVPFVKLSSQVERAAVAAGIKWKHNALRDSFISYRISATGDVSRTALEAGNSPQIINRCYLKVVTKSEADRWFSIVPHQKANILSMSSIGQTG